MQEERIEGIVLQAKEYKERERLVILFTPLGVLHLIVKGVRRGNLMWVEPFAHGEYHVRRGRSDLFTCKEGTLWDAHHEFRNDWTSLRTAGALAQAILQSQLPGKESPSLFSLYRAYHKQVMKAQGPAFLSSFYLKLLSLEGLLAAAPLIEQGWKEEEIQLADRLVRMTQFSHLGHTEVTEEFLEKVELLLQN